MQKVHVALKEEIGSSNLEFRKLKCANGTTETKLTVNETDMRLRDDKSNVVLAYQGLGQSLDLIETRESGLRTCHNAPVGGIPGEDNPFVQWNGIYIWIKPSLKQYEMLLVSCTSGLFANKAVYAEACSAYDLLKGKLVAYDVDQALKTHVFNNPNFVKAGEPAAVMFTDHRGEFRADAVADVDRLIQLYTFKDKQKYIEAVTKQVCDK